MLAAAAIARARRMPHEVRRVRVVLFFKKIIELLFFPKRLKKDSSGVRMKKKTRRRATQAFGSMTGFVEIVGTWVYLSEGQCYLKYAFDINYLFSADEAARRPRPADQRGFARGNWWEE